MLNFRDFLAVNYTGQTQQQDLNAKKRHRGVIGEEEAEKKPESQEETVEEHIVKVKGGYRLVSKKSGKNLGTYPTKAGAEKRERQVQYFKHQNA